VARLLQGAFCSQSSWDATLAGMKKQRENEGDIDLSPKETAILVGEHQGTLAKAKFKIETERDRAILLITGGALTVSFAYVPTLFDKGPSFGLAA